LPNPLSFRFSIASITVRDSPSMRFFTPRVEASGMAKSAAFASPMLESSGWVVESHP
jgi:hypothetical protein